MALIEYATDEITGRLLSFCNCDGEHARITDAHDIACDVLAVRRLLDLALAEQRERIAQDVERKAEATGFQVSRFTLLTAAKHIREMP